MSLYAPTTGPIKRPRQPRRWRGADKSGVVLGTASVSVSLRLKFISSRPSDALRICKFHG